MTESQGNMQKKLVKSLDFCKIREEILIILAKILICGNRKKNFNVYKIPTT